MGGSTVELSAQGCASNPIVCENQLTGNPASEWDVTGAGDPSIQGFATDISVNRGQTISFKIDTASSNYRLDIYRMGYYGGFGARKVATVTPSVSLPQSQPACLTDAPTGLVDCGNWAVSASWAVPATATSGIYFARAVRIDTGGASHIVFIVRDDASTADVLFQTSDTTWQAYNQYGGNSLYVGSPAGRAYKVSYNRPFTTRGTDAGRLGVQLRIPDGALSGVQRLQHRLPGRGGHGSARGGGHSAASCLCVSRARRILVRSAADNVESARGAGVHLAFFSGNEVFWKTRWESEHLDARDDRYRTLVSYKETHAEREDRPECRVDRHVARSAVQSAG